MAESFDFITDLSGLFIVADIHSTYICVSQGFAKLFGWQTAAECSGKTHFDIPCKAVEFAEEFTQLDQKAIQSKTKMLTLEIQNYALGQKAVFVERNPIKNALEEVEGLFNHYIDLTDVNLFRSYLKLQAYDSKIRGVHVQPTCYVLSESHCPLPLTEKQQDCVFHLVRGKSIKEIAKTLGVSPRTIESHFNSIKARLKCDTKAEIIEKAIDSNFLYYIPRGLQNSKLESLILEV